MECSLTENGFTARASFDSNVLSRREMNALLKDFESVVNQFASNPTGPLKDVHALAGDDVSTEAIWDTRVEEVRSCVHDVILERTRYRPFDPAVDAWDGSLTYGQLHVLSDRLAHRLRQSGVGPETKVPLLFEKSVWAVVAMLSVLKAGGCFVCLDERNPIHRVRSLVGQVEGTILLCSEKHKNTYADIADETLPVCLSLFDDLPTAGSPACTNVQPDNAAYSTSTLKTLAIRLYAAKTFSHLHFRDYREA